MSPRDSLDVQIARLEGEMATLRERVEQNHLSSEMQRRAQAAKLDVLVTAATEWQGVRKMLAGIAKFLALCSALAGAGYSYFGHHAR